MTLIMITLLHLASDSYGLSALHPFPYLILSTTLGDVLSFHFIEKEVEAQRG